MSQGSSVLLSTAADTKGLSMLPESFVFQRIDTIQESLGSVEILESTLATMEALSPDEVNKPALINWLKEGIAKEDARWEIRVALRTLARALKPRAYLEIGTRRGWSLAQVACESPETRIWSMDMWVQGYGGVPNPGPGFVVDEIKKVAPVFRGSISFLNGNSHDILPVFLDGATDPDGKDGDLRLIRESEDRPRKFDLVTVDGDHTALGAWWDLCDILPHVALGGAVVFDDLVDRSDEMMGDAAVTRFTGRHKAPDQLRHSLLDVWSHVKSQNKDFIYIENLTALPPIGIAIRVR